ncbi:MAG: hypothetical protein JNJ54_15660 [Myxococcaceae bacterium]|nr:hypothetical protein [Myxococcaceae bacterium]
MRRVLVPLTLVALSCAGNIVGGSAGSPEELVSPGSSREPEPVVRLPAAVACNGTVTGRSYRGFDGAALDGDRLPLAAGQDLARLRDGSDLGNFFESRGIPGARVTDSVVQTFGVVPEHWYANTQASFASVYAAYAMAFHGCLEKALRPVNYHPFGHADFASAPNAASAPRQCQVMGRLLWKREMDAEELSACVDYALEVPSLEPEVKRQWAYVCASVAGAASFLVF